MPSTPVWLAAVESLLNRGLQSSFGAAALAARLEGTSLEIEVVGVTAIRVQAQAGRLVLCAGAAAPGAGPPPPDASISGTPLALLNLARSGRNPAARPVAAEGPGARPSVQIRGDAEIANAYRQLLKLAQPDWEEELSRVVGDFAARRLSQAALQAFAWVRTARRTAGENLAEYLQEESRDLVDRHEVEEFLQGVDALRDGADRVAARLERLERRMQAT